MTALLLLLQDGLVSEPDLKAAFLFNFARHVDWPAEAFPAPEAPFVVVVLSGDPMADAVSGAFSGKVLHGRPVLLRRSKKGEGLDGAHLVFIGTDAEAGPILSALRDSRTLTVGESAGFLKDGGVIRFFLEERRLRFEVALPAAGRAGLRVSSKLLRVARLVRGEE